MVTRQKIEEMRAVAKLAAGHKSDSECREAYKALLDAIATLDHTRMPAWAVAWVEGIETEAREAVRFLSGGAVRR